MIPYPRIDPDIITIGPLSIRWYGTMYVIGFTASYLLIRYQAGEKGLAVSRDQIDNLCTALVLVLIIGARLGYVLFYNPGHYLGHPAEIFAVWEGGMSFHGGLIGAVTGGVFFVKRKRLDFWTLSDLVIVTAPIGIGLGRLGNFINGELYGRVTDVPWAMVFPGGGSLPRHPSQLYELLLEGIVLFILLWTLKDRNLRAGALTSLFLIFYGSFRFFVEFFRDPDAQLGFIISWLTMGQILSTVMILFGVGIFFIERPFSKKINR